MGFCFITSFYFMLQIIVDLHEWRRWLRSARAINRLMYRLHRSAVLFRLFLNLILIPTRFRSAEKWCNVGLVFVHTACICVGFCLIMAAAACTHYCGCYLSLFVPGRWSKSVIYWIAVFNIWPESVQNCIIRACFPLWMGTYLDMWLVSCSYLSVY